jgi:RimJ/RimL family protein N-acetyltransferase
MEPTAAEMKLAEVGILIDYFHNSTPEHLDTMGVDPTRLLTRTQWREYYAEDYSKPIEKRRTFLVVWKSGATPIGFSSADKIVYGEEARMHLHILNPEHRKAGFGTMCVRQTVEIYFAALKLERLFCEPNAFNIAPNRTMQRVGFKYLKTYYTVPGPLNYHQAVTKWVLERSRS